MNGYDLSRTWFDFAFENKDCKVQHTALYLWIVELNNRLGWKKEFGIPTHDTMEGLSIGNKNTYLTALKDLARWGFIRIVAESKNQYQSCIISICHSKSDTAQVTALDTALIQHSTQHSNGIEHGIGISIVPIDKPLNKETKKPINKSVKIFTPPTLEQVKDFFKEKNYPEKLAVTAFDYYEAGGWHDSKGNQVKNWKQKMLSVWMKEENKQSNGKHNNGVVGQLAPLKVEFKDFGTFKQH